MPKPNCDILIIGSGAAGLIAALALADKNFNVLVITKDAVTESSSAYAQGGIAVSLLPTDSPKKHIQDTLKVGLGLCEPKAVEFFINKITDSIQKLSAWGIPFSGYKEGKVAEDVGRADPEDRDGREHRRTPAVSGAEAAEEDDAAEHET